MSPLLFVATCSLHRLVASCRLLIPMATCRLWQVAVLRFDRIRSRTFETTFLVVYRPLSVPSSKHLLENNIGDDEIVGMIQAFSGNNRHIRR